MKRIARLTLQTNLEIAANVEMASMLSALLVANVILLKHSPVLMINMLA